MPKFRYYSFYRVMFKLNIIILIVIAVLGASLLGFFIVRDLRSSVPSEEAKFTEETSGKNEGDNSPKASVEEAVSPPLGNRAGETAKSSSALPDLARPVMYKALVREEDKSKLEAEIKAVSETLEDNPDYFQGWLQLGILRKYIGDYEGAALVCEYGAKIRPYEYVTFNNLGDIYHFYLKNFPKSESAIKKVIELKPDYIPAYRNLFELYTFSYKEKVSLADDVLLDGISKNPKAYELMVVLAMHYKEQGDKVSARKYLEEALKLNPPNRSAIEAELSGI